MRAKGRSPTSAIAPPASIENHAGGQSPSQISIKLLGCQQSQAISKPLFDQSKLLILNGLKRVLKPALDIHYIHSREGDGVRALGTLPVAIWTISLLYVRVNHFRVRLDTGKITRGEVSQRQRRSFYAYPTT